MIPVLRPMTEAEHAAWLARTIPAYAADKVASGQWTADEAVARSAAEYRELLPDGLATADNHLYSVLDADGAGVGVLWFAAKTKFGTRIAYVYDIEIQPERRREGHARAAFGALEEEARRLGLAGIALHVFGHNAEARALYEQLGFEPTNLSLYKPLDGARAAARPSHRVRAIGVVRSEFASKVGVPIQTAGAPDRVAALEVHPEFAAGLRDLDGFEYVILLTRMHLGTEEPLEVVPFLDDAPHGVFATRAPSRPNRIGLSIVRLLAIDGTTLRFAGNDMVDGTPVLDIKPYVPAFDVRTTDRIGWFADRIDALPGKLADDRMR